MYCLRQILRRTKGLESGSVRGIRGRGMKRPSGIVVRQKAREESRSGSRNEYSLFLFFSFRLLGLNGLA